MANFAVKLLADISVPEWFAYALLTLLGVAVSVVSLLAFNGLKNVTEERVLPASSGLKKVTETRMKPAIDYVRSQAIDIEHLNPEQARAAA